MPRIKTKDVIVDEGITFKDMYLSPAVLEGLGNAGFTSPSPVQLKCIPLAKVG
jgi:superfamily II DNA/RNA helicase